MKPRKYGVKLMWLIDSHNDCLIIAYIFTPERIRTAMILLSKKRYTKLKQAVLIFIKAIQNTNRNITANNWFMTIELVHIFKK